jgi:hypothetical protein
MNSEQRAKMDVLTVLEGYGLQPLRATKREGKMPSGAKESA